MASEREREERERERERADRPRRPDASAWEQRRRVVGSSLTVEDVITAAFDLTTASPPSARLQPANGTGRHQRLRPPAIPSVLWWFEQMGSGHRLIEERMTWFWHDHFAMHVRKIGVPYLAIQHAHMLRSHATGNFADLLHSVAVDPAMLLYLDTVRSTADSPNENFAREVMELHTLGTGNYSEQDIIELARAMTGWVVANPARRRVGLSELDEADPWTSVFVDFRWDSSPKTFLGTTSDFDMHSAIDQLLSQPATATFIATKLYRDLVGLEPDPNELAAMAVGFGQNYEIMPLIEVIVASPAFVSDDAIRAKIRSPLEKLAGIINGFETRVDQRTVQILNQVSYAPFSAPNPAGYAKGLSLLGPYQYVHVFDLAAPITAVPDISTHEIFARLGIYNVSPTSVGVVAGASSPEVRIALAIASPEYALV